VVAAVQIRDYAEIRVRLPADEESYHKHRSCLGPFKVSCVEPSFVFAGLSRRTVHTELEDASVVVIASDTKYHDEKHTSDYNRRNKVQESVHRGV